MLKTSRAQLNANKRYHEKNKTKIKQYMGSYYGNNAEELKARRRLRYFKEQRKKKLNKFILAHLIKLNIHV